MHACHFMPERCVLTVNVRCVCLLTGIQKGVSIIVGGGFHGKSTLLSALELGVYNHIPGDGREFVVCDPTATKIRSEDGRYGMRRGVLVVFSGGTAYVVCENPQNISHHT